SDILKKFHAPSTHPSSFLVSFEGLEGAGKSLQILNFKEFLEKQGWEVLLVREPGGTLFGEKIREAILQSSTALTPLAEALAFACSRAQLLSENILPYLQKEKRVVIVDRFIDSSLAYQGMGRSLNFETILNLHSYAPLTALPHLTFYLAIPWETSLERMKTRGKNLDYFELQGEDFFKKVSEGYDLSQKLFPERIKRIQGTDSPDQVFKEICHVWEHFICHAN
ncbi:MAG: dTMP kinase, partial [Bacteriovoracaceae bacterium]|nr:dTMP kinase [Bacteriovoracaceae bacterium]